MLRAAARTCRRVSSHPTSRVAGGCSNRASRSSAPCTAGGSSPSPPTSAAGWPRSRRSSAASGSPAGASASRTRGRSFVQAADAYRACADIARASGTSFYRGMRLLPSEKRDALFAIYAFARRVDDVADEGDGDRLAQLAELRAWREQLDDPVFFGLDDACMRFPIPVDALDDLLDGAEMDVRGTRYATFDE